MRREKRNTRRGLALYELNAMKQVYSTRRYSDIPIEEQKETHKNPNCRYISYTPDHCGTGYSTNVHRMQTKPMQCVYGVSVCVYVMRLHC